MIAQKESNRLTGGRESRHKSFHESSLPHRTWSPFSREEGRSKRGRLLPFTGHFRCDIEYRIQTNLFTTTSTYGRSFTHRFTVPVTTHKKDALQNDCSNGGCCNPLNCFTIVNSTVWGTPPAHTSWSLVEHIIICHHLLLLGIFNQHPPSVIQIIIMTKITISALTMALLIRGSNAACDPEIVLGATCDLAALETAIAGMAECTTAQLFPGGDVATAVEELCKYDAPVQFVEIQGTYQLDLRSMNGGGDVKDGENSFDIDVARVKRFIDNEMDDQLISWPNYAQREEYNAANGYGNNGYMNNFNIDPVAEKGSCKLKTAMCCFVESAKDNFVDNSDACHHDLSHSPQSNHVNSGWSLYSGDEPTHCVGFTWKDGEDSDTYKGNALFYASLYQTATKGYMGNIPGAPMCACVEQMPVVTKADCVTARGAGLSYKFAVDAATGEVSASHSVTMTYSDCGANDLKAQVKAVHSDNTDILSAIDEHLVGESCDVANANYLNDEQLLVTSAKNEFKDLDGAVEEGRAWKQLFGEGVFFLPPDFDPEAADKEMRADINACRESEDRYCLILRKCPSCTVESHKEIVYKRITPFNEFQEGISTATTMDIPNLFMNQWREVNNKINVDYELYSSIADALAGTNAWQVADYNTNDNKYGFPRNSGPDRYVFNQWNSYAWNGGHANQHGFYVEVPGATTSA
jgi:hypothetical protein